MDPSMKKLVVIIALGTVGLSILLSAIPASATSLGMTSNCTVVNPNRFQCNFTGLATNILDIQYVSMQCGTTGGAFSIQAFQVFTVPPNTSSEVAYQIPISNQASVGGVVSAGSPVTFYAKAGSTPRALIDLIPAPVHPGTQCTVSLSGVE
jgi:hypothetical protein